jgi:5,10-methylenetetrahydromethanopterin reductase
MTKIGIAFDGLSSLPVALEFAERAETAGVSSFWTPEHLGFRESLIEATALVMKTKRAKIVPVALSPYTRQPIIAAMAGSTLEEIGPGRIAFTIGVGNPLFLKENGVALRSPLKAISEYIDCLRNLWAGEPVTFEGSFCRLSGARLGFTPPEPLKLYLAATRDRMLSLAGEKADGVVLSAGLTPSYISHSIGVMEKGAIARGRRAKDVHSAAIVMGAVSPDGREAVDACRDRLAFLFRNQYLDESIKSAGIPIDHEGIIAAISKRDLKAAAALISDDVVEAFTISGTAQACRKRLEEYMKVGIDEIALTLKGKPEYFDLALEVLRPYCGS